MKTRRCGVYAAMAVITLVAALLVTNCTEPMDMSGLFGGSSGSSPNTGFLRLNFVDTEGRTIIPALFPTIDEYNVSLIATTDGQSTNHNGLTPGTGAGTIGNTFTPQIGTYTILVVGFVTDNSDPANELVRGQITGVVISESSAATPTITLDTGVVDGDGSFAWDMTTFITALGLTGPDTATMSFARIGGGAAPANIDLITENNGTLPTVTAGYYNVTITINKADHYTYATNQVVHIYRYFTSSWIQGTAFDVKEMLTHTVNYDTKGQASAIVADSIVHGEVIPTDPVHDNTTDVLVGWFTTDGGSSTDPEDWGIRWIFGDAMAGTPLRVLSNRTLYALWTLSVTGDLTITLTEALANETSKLPSGNITISHGNFLTPNQSGANSHLRTITVDNTGTPFVANSFAWTINGVTVAANNTNELTMNFNDFITSNTGLTAEGTFFVTVTATCTADTKPWSARILVTVTQ